MGTDLHREDKVANQKRARDYVRLKSHLCSILHLDCAFDNTGPGHYQGATDDDVIAGVERLVRIKETS